MNTLAIEKREAAAESVSVTEDTLTVHLADGRTLSVPLAWYPRLPARQFEGTHRWRLIGRRSGHPLARFGRRHPCRRTCCWPTVRRGPGVVQALAGGSEDPGPIFPRRPNQGIQPTRRQKRRRASDA